MQIMLKLNKQQITIFYHRFITIGVLFMLLATACKKTPTPQEEEELRHPNITTFKFSKEKNSALFFDLQGKIEGDTIFVRYFAGADVSNLIPEYDTIETERVEVNGKPQQSGKTSADFSTLVKYEAISGKSRKALIVKFMDLGVPAIYISTGGAPILNKEDYVDGTYKFYGGTPGKIIHEGTLEMKGRGNSTWNMPKKPYRLKLEEKKALLGMPENKSWALMANYSDRSLMRNEIAFEVSRRTQLEYTPRQKYVDFFLNGEYQGLYNIAEHQQTGKYKINVEEKNGGYFLEVDGYARQEPLHFITPKGTPVTIKFPDEDEITEQQRTYITDYYTEFENALFSDDFKDPEKGYRKYLDMPSFINYYLANEISGNPDMLWSMKMYKKSSIDPKLYTGPVWDFDLAVNNDKRLGDASQKLMLEHALFIRQWIDRLRQDVAFKQDIKTRWNQIKPSLQSLPAYVDSIAALLQYSQKPNFIKWDILREPNIHQSWYTGNTYENYVLFLRNYYSNRISWLDQVFNSDSFLRE